LSILEEEKILLQGLANNDKTAIEKVYQQNFSAIKLMVLNNNGDIDDAKDIFQEAIIVLFQKVKEGNFELTCQLKTYLYAIGRRLWLKKLQHQKRFSFNAEPAAEVASVEEDVEMFRKKEVDFELMEIAMNKIGEPCRGLLNAYYIEKKNMQEISTSFGYTNADNAKTQKYKCLVRLKKIFFAQ
jgi:RNA polymerase sigma factor (sigma-70 family)